MPTQDKTTKLWTGNVQRRGYPRKVKKGFLTKTRAKDWERITWLNLKNPQKTLLTFSQASTKYLKWCEKRRKLNTYRQKTFIITTAITALQSDPPLSDITKTLIEKCLDSRFEKDGGKSANRDLRELHTLFNWLIEHSHCDHNPCKGVEKYQEEMFIKYVPPPEDINSVLLQASPLEYDFLQCIYHLAARKGEIQRLKWEDINFETGTLILWTMKRKGGSYESDEMKINSVLNEILEDRYKNRDRQSPFVFPNKEGGAISKNTLDNIMPKLCLKAKIKPFTLHSIRHHVAAVMADSKKLSLIEIQRQLRLKRATTTDIYLKSLITGENRAADVLENAQKKVFHTKVHTLKPKKKAGVKSPNP